MNKKTGYPSIDKPWEKYYSDETINAPLLTGTFYENLFNENKKYLDDIALVYFGNKITYRDMFYNVERVRNALLNNGVKKDDKVIMFTSSTPETVYTILALGRIGATANMINPLFTCEQIQNRTNETDANIMIVLDKLWDKILDIKTQLLYPFVHLYA